ncbi:MAG: transketolase [Anaerolineaceae bacterium]|nr:transketolase [Anaerolineaceae bacterium]
MDHALENKAINAIRFLSADGVQQANSGHPGLPMGAAAIAYTLWTRHLKFNPKNPNWFDRDRFVLSGGHGSMLLYSLLYLTGFDLSLDDLKNFRQVGSKTPGHPEYGLTPGVETTTGPLGQGFANGVGMAIAEAHLAAEFNKPDLKIVDHYTYAIVTDGDLMEGVASEAASLAGHLRLGKLIYFYDDNHISIDGSTDLAFTEDRGKRFEAYHWQVLYVEDGNDVEAIDQAIKKAKADPRPSLIICRTHIGFGLPTLQDTADAHGKPPGDEELNAAKEKMGWPTEPRFYVPDDVLAFYRQAVDNGADFENNWNNTVEEFKSKNPLLGKEFERRINGLLPEKWEDQLPVFPADKKGMGSRVASGKVLNALANDLPELMGGSADLTPSNNTWIKGGHDFQADSPDGRYIRFGVREHAMGAILNGLAVHQGVMPYGASFLVFTDYARPAIRLSALMGLPVKWIFTHDSIGLGEDGPTHQPIEHLASLRAIPNLIDIRPADANEVTEAWRVAVLSKNKPVLMALSRQNLPTFNRDEFNSASGLSKGAYILKDYGSGMPKLILLATGSEVELIVAAAQKLADDGVNVRVVSMPSWSLFEAQDQSYRDSVLPPEIKNRVAVEAAASLGWHKWVGQGKIIAIDRFGESGPYEEVYEELGLTVDTIYKAARELID